MFYTVDTLEESHERARLDKAIDDLWQALQDIDAMGFPLRFYDSHA